MFPKFLRVVTAKFIQHYEWINETTRVWKNKPLIKDQEKIDAIANALRFSYEVVFAPDGKGIGERLPNGSWTKALGMIQRREVDLLISAVGVTQERHEAFRLIYPFAVDEVTFVTQKPEPVQNNAVSLQPFSIQVWISIITSVCLVAFLFKSLLRRRHSAIKLFISTLSTLVGQGIELTPQGLREYFVLGSWILGSSLLYHFYAAVLLSFLLFPFLEGIRTIEDLANGVKEGKYECATYENYPYVLSGQPNSSAQVIGNELARKRGTDYFINYLDGFRDKNHAFVGLRSEFHPYKDFYFISEENFFSSFLAFATHKEFCCGPELDKVMHHIWSSGIFEKVAAEQSFVDFLLNLDLYDEFKADPASEGQLTMAQFRGPFIFLIVSHSLACFIFVIEVCLGKFKHCKIVSKC